MLSNDHLLQGSKDYVTDEVFGEMRVLPYLCPHLITRS